MSSGDNRQQAYPQNTHKQDWALYTFVGGRGAGGFPTTVVTRYSFWIDFDPFDIKNLTMLSQNVNFQIFNDTFLSTPYIPLFIVDQSNDFTDELVIANTPTVSGQSIGIGTATINYPPFGYSDQGFSTSPGIPPTSSATPAPTNVAVGGTSGGSLVAGTTYYYVVTAVKGGVESIASSVVSFTATATKTIAQISFTNVIGADTYIVYRSLTNSFSSGSLNLSSNFVGGQPPYYLNTIFTSQPASGSFRNDQGNWTLKSLKNYGFGFGGTNMVTQGFVPQQSQLTGFFLGQLFHTNTNDHTKFVPINIELWDANKNFIQHLVTIQPTFDASVKPTGLTTDSGGTASCNNLSYNIGDDGLNYWVTLNQVGIQLNNAVSLTPGALYYIVVRAATLTTSNYYFLGNNTDVNSARDPLYYYPFASAYSATDGSSTWSQIVDVNSKPITFPFVTQGNSGRYAVTYWWANIGAGGGDYWAGVPNVNDYIFLHVDYNQRI